MSEIPPATTDANAQNPPVSPESPTTDSKENTSPPKSNIILDPPQTPSSSPTLNAQPSTTEAEPEPEPEVVKVAVEPEPEPEVVKVAVEPEPEVVKVAVEPESEPEVVSKQPISGFTDTKNDLVTLPEVSETSTSVSSSEVEVVEIKSEPSIVDKVCGSFASCRDGGCPCDPLVEVEVSVEGEEAKNLAYGKATESIYDSSLIIDSYEFDYVVTKLRQFFKGLGFLEAHPQNRLSILAACEDPYTVAKFDYAGKVWPLPQTGQMWLEYELLKNPKAKGDFCLSTSYRQEQTPIDGRHDLIFPLFEFEMHGGIDALVAMEKDLLRFLGYDESKFVEGAYGDVAKEYGVEELESEHEARLAVEKSATFFLKDFPESTDPFWNMRRYDGDKKDIAKKVDVILSGQETFGSAEREVDKEVMRNRFNTISDGGYKKKLYDLFGAERTEREMKDYLDFEFFERCGGGIGMTRLIRSMKAEGLMPDLNKKD